MAARKEGSQAKLDHVVDTVDLTGNDHGCFAHAGSSVSSRGASGSDPVVLLDSDDSDDAGASSGSHPIEVVPPPWRRPRKITACPVCLCDSEPSEAVSLSGCGHNFCEDCITH